MKRFLQILAITLAIGAAVQVITSPNHNLISQAVACGSPGG